MITQRIRLYRPATYFQVFGTGSLFSGLKLYELTTLPSWITKGGFDPWIGFVSIDTLTVSEGTYTYYFTLGGSPSIADACLIIEVVNSAITIPYIDNCNTNAKNIMWITREGGRASYIFDQRKDYSVVAGGAVTYETINNEVKYIDKGKVYDAVTVYKSGIRDVEVEYIASLRNSIQAWEYNETTDAFTPIIIEQDKFNTLSSKVKFNEVSFSYRYAKSKSYQNG